MCAAVFASSRPKLTDKPGPVQSANLIERDLPALALEHAIDARGKLFVAAGHRRDDNGPNDPMHFIGRNDQARPRLTHLRPDRRIEPREVDGKSLNGHHVHSLSSKSLDMFCQSRHSSKSSPCSATAARNCFFPTFARIALRRTGTDDDVPAIHGKLNVVFEARLLDERFGKPHAA